MLLLFYALFFGHKAKNPMTEPAPPALEGEILTPGQPEAPGCCF